MENDKIVFQDDFNILDGVEDIFEQKFGPTDAPTDTPPVDDNTPTGDEPNDNLDTDSEDQDDITGEEPDSDKDDIEDTPPNLPSDDEDEDGDDASPLTPYAKYLKDEGILPNLNLEEFDGSVNSLKDGMYNEISNGIKSYVESLPERVKNIIQNYEEGVALDKLIQIDSEKLKYSSITEEQLTNVDTQKSILKDFYKKTTRFSDERIEKELTRLEDLQELEDEAKNVLSELVVIQDEEVKAEAAQAKQAQLEAEERSKKELLQLQEAIKKTEEIVPGIQLTDGVRDVLFKDLTTVVGYDGNNNPVNKLGAYRLQNPVQTELIMTYIFNTTKGFTDWSTLAKSGKNTAIKELERAARTLDDRSRNTNNPSKKSSSLGKDLTSAIDRFINAD